MIYLLRPGSSNCESKRLTKRKQYNKQQSLIIHNNLRVSNKSKTKQNKNTRG